MSGDHNANQKGIKFDSNKARWSLVPEGVMEEVVQVLEYGAAKYAPDNWKHVPEATTRYYDAAMRHIDAWWRGEAEDGETGRSHLAHAICCLMFLQWLEKNQNEEEFCAWVEKITPGTWVEVDGKEFK